ncbi:TlpA family protein disulfide reductase [Maribacter arenosus]|uniref:TlpA family protein disulfide reductase n=1 Tax=Maribacter arenosus TaxID=1854708 RepID=A0ABR7VDS0_9FLAO|nr:TlpA disulfide reductase family protein [Maribacter arenosus]MBD0851086.1 TlpA family protein disulfide reductase [Maribacter arenosus]
MKIKRKTVLNILLFAFVLSFFMTPLGHFSKVFLNRLFASSPNIIDEPSRQQMTSYDWQLKNADWDFFNLQKSRGKVLFINFWASWKLPSEAELKGIQELYEEYKGQVDFYIITNEERPPVEEFMQLKKFTFPVTYLIIGEPAPFEILDPPGTYIIDRNGYIVVKEDDISDWDRKKIKELLNDLVN